MDALTIYFLGVLLGVALSLLVIYLTMISDKEIKKDIENIEKIQKLIDYIDCMGRKEANHD